MRKEMSDYEIASLEFEKLKSLVNVIIDSYDGLDIPKSEYRKASNIANLLCVLEDQLDATSDMVLSLTV